MPTRWVIGGFVACLVFAGGLFAALGGDSLYGKVVRVESGQLVTLDYGGGQYDVRIVGIDVPEGPLAEQADKFLTDLVLGKNARMRLEYRAENGEMVARLFTDDPVIGIREVGVELVRAGLARRLSGYEDKNGELAAAEREARAEKRGLWATAQ